METLIVIAAVGAVLIIYFVYLNNKLVSLSNSVNSAFSSIDVMLKYRHDLIPNLVQVVNQYMQHESGLLTQLTELRLKATSAVLNTNEKVQLDNELSKSFMGLMVAAENYPDLKASNNVVDLQRSWAESEEQIAAARRTYNAAVTRYNNGVQIFPSSLMAGSQGYKLKPLFEASANEKMDLSANGLFGK